MAPGKRPLVVDFQNETVEVHVRCEGVEEGRENWRGHHVVKWVFDKRLGANQTTSVMAKLKQNISRSFYIRDNYAYVLLQGGS